MTDHKAKAESFIAAELAGGSFDQTRDYIALAQVHATLYLAEQQRIANLIELSKGAAGATARMAAYEALLDQEGEGFSIHEFVRPEIREALGLS